MLFMSSTKALASMLSLRAQAAGKKSKICMFFIKEDMEIKEGEILSLRPLAMSRLRALAGSPQDFSVPHTHMGHGREEGLGEDMSNEGME